MGAVKESVGDAPLPVGLTYMTGTLVKIGQCLGQPGLRRDAVPLLLHWLALVGGAVLGTWAYMALAHSALVVAAELLAALALWLPSKD